MNVYFDSSAIVKLLVQAEAHADDAVWLYEAADRRSTSRVAYAECRAAIAAAERAGRLRSTDARKARNVLDAIWPNLDRLSVDEDVVHQAGDLAERRALRGFDAIHLASALSLPPDAALASWDDELLRAAQAEGLSLASPLRER